MFIKYNIPKIDISLLDDKIYSFSYSEIEDEPSYLHSHRQPEIIIPQTNYCKLITSKKEIPMQKGKLYIITPHMLHTETKPFAYCNANYFSVKINGDISQPQKRKQILVIENNTDIQELNSYLLMAKKNFENNKNTQLATINLHCFFLAFCNILNGENLSLTDRKSKEVSTIVSEIKYYISNNLGTQIKIDELCKKFNVSHNLLLQKFKKEVGISLIRYLNNQRMATATYLLKSSDYTVSQIATMCSFDSPAYFSYIFKKNFGKTPKEYRAEEKS